jgi:peptide/nickel transport system permease protein
MTPVMVNATSDFGFVVLVVSSLSFLGLGAKPPMPEWGTMVAEGSQNFYQWWLALTPGLAIVTIILGFNFLGDGVRDELDKRSATK